MEMLKFGRGFSSIPEDIKTEIVLVARDSVRTTLELFARCLSAGSALTRAHLGSAIESLQENLLTAAQSTLQGHHLEFRRLVKEIKKKAIDQSGQITGPVQISISAELSDSLFDTSTKLSRFVDSALRSGAFCLCEGHRWAPGLKPNNLELPPILAWHKGARFWKHNSALPIEISLQESEVLRYSGGPMKPPTLFIAFRLKSSESVRFRDELEKAIHAHPNLREFRVVDGRTHAGASWAPEVRSRIVGSRLVIGDVTGMKPDVLFELGFAYGLGKPTIPAGSMETRPSSLPTWLTSIQIGSYGTKGAMNGLVSSIVAHLSDSEGTRLSQPLQPVPSLAVWVRELAWNQHSKEQFLTAAQACGLKPEIFGSGSRQ